MYFLIRFIINLFKSCFEDVNDEIVTPKRREETTNLIAFINRPKFKYVNETESLLSLPSTGNRQRSKSHGSLSVNISINDN